MGFPSKVRHAVDAEPSIVLRQLADGAETASAVEAAISLDVNTQAYWTNGAIPFEQAAAVIRVTALDTSTDETYAIQLQVDSDEAFAGADFTVIAEIDIDSTGVFVINLDGPTIKALRSDARFLRAALVAGGTTPSITYEAWLAPATGNAA
jgi:hypothetical protein